MTQTATKEVKFLDLAEAKAGSLPQGKDGWLEAKRIAARERFAELGVPTMWHEEWRFTNLNPLNKTEFVNAPEVEVTAEQLAPFLEDKLDGARLVFVNGRYVIRASATLSEV